MFPTFVSGPDRLYDTSLHFFAPAKIFARLSYDPPLEATKLVNEHHKQPPLQPVGEPELRDLLEQNHAMSHGWALICCASHPGDAEDVLQEAYRKILEGRARYDGRSAFKTWLFAVIRNTAASERRRHWTRLLRLGSYRNERANDLTEPKHGDDLDAATRLSIFRKSLATLPRRQQEVLHLVFYQNLTVEAAAQVMSISVGSARTHYDRAKKRMAELLRETGLYP